MLKPNNKIFAILQIFLDIIAVIFSVYLTFLLRIELNPLFDKKFSFEIVHSYMPPIYLTILVFIFVFNYFGLYRFSKRENFLDIFFSVIKSISLSIMALMLIAFLFRAENYSRSLILMLWAGSIIPLNLSHLLGVKILKWSRARGFGVERIAIIGLDEKTKKIVRNIESMKSTIYQFAGYIQSRGEKQIIPAENSSVVLGKLDDLVRIINDHMIDRIVVSESSLTQPELFHLLEICERMEVHLDRIPDFLTITSKKINISEIDGVLLIGIRKVTFTRWDQILKRIFDLTIAAVTILLSFPFLVIISFLIKIDSKGSVLYKQRRIGKGGKNFYFFKFRSMFADAEKQREELSPLNEADGYLFKVKNDPRITRIGKFIRKYSIDELASLWNVLVGEMSLVGPRPLPYSDMEKDLENPKYKFWAEKRSEVPPGITGLWQISGRSDLDFEEMVKLDIYYVENWSLLLDLKILLKTFVTVLSGRGSY